MVPNRAKHQLIKYLTIFNFAKEKYGTLTGRFIYVFEVVLRYIFPEVFFVSNGRCLEVYNIRTYSFIDSYSILVARRTGLGIFPCHFAVSQKRTV